MAKREEPRAEQENDEEAGPRDFGVFLRNVNDGRFLGECAGELQDLTRSLLKLAEAKGKAKGQLVITLNLLYEAGAVAVIPDVVAKKPRRPRGTTWMFANDGGQLSLERERQTSLPIRAVKNPETKQAPLPATAEPKQV